MKLPNLRKVFIGGLSGLRTLDDTAALLSFIQNSLPDTLPTFCLYNESGSHWKYLEDYVEVLDKPLKNVTDEVYFFGFRLQAATMARILQTWHNAERVSFVNCEIGDGNFRLAKSIPYKIKSLNISSNTCDMNDQDWLNSAKLDKLFAAIGKTVMKNCLEKVIINGDRFPPEDLADILAKNGCNETSVTWKYELKPMD
jgi:hypothetical protein